mgnify:CR=1 FL=1
MAKKDLNKKPFINDRDENIFIGIDLPFRKSDGPDGWFASTSTTIESVKNNIKNLLNTKKGERLMQPNLGLDLNKLLFNQLNDDTIEAVRSDIIDAITRWLPFVEIRKLNIITEGTLDSNVGANTIVIDLIFNINRDPNTLESIQVEINGE